MALPRAVVVVLVALASTGCAPPRPVESEVGTPAARLPGTALVLLPRTCVTKRSVPDWHFGRRAVHGRPPPPGETTLGLRAAIDALVGPDLVLANRAAYAEARREEACEDPPDLDFRPDLSRYRASDEALDLMRAREADVVVVLEVHTTMACARPDGSPLLAYYAAVRDAGTAPSFVVRDVCLEDDITVTAWMFDRDGVARWALSRDVQPGDPPAWTIDRVLDRVPVTIPKRSPALLAPSARGPAG